MSDEKSGTRTRKLDGSRAGGLVYGAVVTGSVLVAVGGHGTPTHVVVATWAFVIITYWLTHVYVHATGRQFHGDDRHLGHRTLTSAGAELAVLVGGIPGIVAFMIAAASNLENLTAEKVALIVTVFVLAGVGFLGAKAAGKPLSNAVVEAVGGATLGLILVAAKTALH